MADDSFYDTHQLTSMLGQLSLSLASQATERLLVKDQNAKVVFTTGCIVQFITHVRHYWCLFLLTCQEGCENTGDELFPNFWCMFFAAFMGEPSAWTCSQFVKAFSESWPLRERESHNNCKATLSLVVFVGAVVTPPLVFSPQCLFFTLAQLTGGSCFGLQE